MTDAPLPAGKLAAPLLRRLLGAHARPAADVLLPPGIGEDAAVLAVGDGALAVATDPITLTGREIGGHAVVINANDVAVMGIRPRWFLAVLLLPRGSTEAEVAAIFDDMRQALDRLDVVLVGGHTEITAAVSQPVVVGQMLGFAADGRFVRTGGLAPGDAVLQVGPAPVEGTAVLANEAAARLGGLAPELLAEAHAAVVEPGISVVGPALLAADLGASSLHDPTEGGLSAGLWEMAEASGLALTVDPAAALWYPPGLAVCRALGADPWGTLASGALLAGFARDRVADVRAALHAAGHATALLARAEAGSGVAARNGKPFRRYEQDELSRVLAES